VKEIYTPGIEGLEAPYFTSQDMEQRLQTEGLWTPRVELAMTQALDSHYGKLRDDGRPYLDEHVFPVSKDVLEYMLQRGKSPHYIEPVLIASLLHDTVEDDENYEIEQCQLAFGKQVSVLVYILTKYGPKLGEPGVERQKIGHDIYMKKLFNAPKDAQVIKLFDRINNLTCSILLASRNPDKLRRYTLETETDYLPLADLLLDKSFYSRLNSLVQLGYNTLRDIGEVQ
jgi:guanosine-3',5'-bis(diphosphate) 3'-pyrophosphohydrolase